jgi:hypothetical protein
MTCIRWHSCLVAFRVSQPRCCASTEKPPTPTTSFPLDDFEYVIDAITPWIDKYISLGPESLAPRELIGVGVWMLDAEVNNGGFIQYYSNSRGRLALATVQGLRRIGASETASILEAANKDVPAFPLPEDREERFRLLDQIAEVARFRALEAEYYEQREDRITLLAEYLRSSAPGDA